MRIILYISIFIFIGCSDSPLSSSTSSVVPIDNNSSQIKTVEPLFYQQWTIEHNKTFYSKNNINQDAHINPKDIFERYTGKGVKIAIIDNGFDINHPEIKDKIIATVSVGSRGAILGNDVSHTLSSDSHGTAVAGIIASSIDGAGTRGIAPDVKLILIKMANSFDSSGEIELFKQAVLNGADIINCSWGTNNVSDVVKDYINTITSTKRDGKGVIIIFASGNKNQNMQNDESAISTVIGVGATSKDNLRTSYSNYGKDLDIVVPGGEYLGIASIDPVGIKGASNNNYIRYDEYNNGKNVSFVGTSASAPILSGIIALALEKDNNITRHQMQNILQYSTDTIGQNTPYLDKHISSNLSTPTISGLLGTYGNSNIKIKLISEKSSSIYGPYSIAINGDNTYSSLVTDNLLEGNYTIEAIDPNDTIIWATNENFQIKYTGINDINKTIRRSDFYGYGKINLYKLMYNIK